MSTKMYAIVSSAIFAIVAVVHLIRMVLDRSVMISGWDVPLWMSGVALIVAGFLSFEGFQVFRHSKMG